MTLFEAMQIAQTGFNTWCAKPHNAGWWARIDGTPIPNDLIVCIAEAFATPSTPTDTPSDVREDEEPSPVVQRVLADFNRRVSELCRDGFTPDDFADAYTAITTSKHDDSGALLSNRYNIILAALRRASLPPASSPVVTVEERLIVAAYRRGFEWAVENGAVVVDSDVADYLDKAAFDYADATLSVSPSPPSDPSSGGK